MREYQIEVDTYSTLALIRQGLTNRFPQLDSNQHVFCVYDLIGWAKGAPAEGIEPSKTRLTAGCLTIRLRWNIRLERVHIVRSQISREHAARARRAGFDAKFSMSEDAFDRMGPCSSGHRVRTCLSGFRGQCPAS